MPSSYEYNKDWARRNPEKWKRYQRNSYLKRKYGITLDDYDQMMDDQEGCCAICSDFSATLYVDHCHTTGTVRGLLCHYCNTGIGMLREDPAIFAKALSYLEDNRP